jgi:hypothetical protein
MVLASVSCIASWSSPYVRTSSAMRACCSSCAPLRLQLATISRSASVWMMSMRTGCLAEAVGAVHRLDEVVELEADAGEDLAVAVALEVAAAAGDDRLRRQDPVRPSLKSMMRSSRSSRSCEPHTLTASGIACLQAWRSSSRSCQTMKWSPGLGDELAHLWPRAPAGCRASRARRPTGPSPRPDQQALPVLLGAGRGVVARDLVPAHVERRQDVAVVAVAEVARLRDEDRPARHPQPELGFLVRVQREVPGLLAVTLEEARQRLAGVHHAEVAGVVDQLLVPVRVRRGRGDELELDRREGGQELLIGLAAVAAQDAGLVQAGARKRWA